MSTKKKEVYGLLGQPKTQPRKLDFEEARRCKGSERKGRGEKQCMEALKNLSLAEESDICNIESKFDSAAETNKYKTTGSMYINLFIP